MSFHWEIVVGLTILAGFSLVASVFAPPAALAGFYAIVAGLGGLMVGRYTGNGTASMPIQSKEA